VTALLVAIAIFVTASLSAQTAGQKTFASSKEAIGALIQALRAGNNTELQSILGVGSEAIISSGDDVADTTARGNFVAKYDAKHSLVGSGEHRFTLNVGTDDWPLPIPLVDNSGKWYFDGAAGKEEILYRRIGHNELSAISVCKGVVAAQHDYAAASHDGQPAGTYATRIVSESGKQNGIYWEAKSGEPSSPAGELLAEASREGYDTSGKQTPYHGYYYRMLKDPGGFAFIAYPAQYRSSGVMTFVVTQNGVIHEKDLGEKTGVTAGQMQQYHLDGTWKQVE
jgi:hypothetical protein